MPAQSKIDMLAKVNETLEASQGFYVVDYRGLTVKESQELRRSLREAGGTMKVFKNNIVKLALQQKEMPALDETLVGTCSYVFFGDDPVSPAKVLKEFAQKTKKTEVLGGNRASGGNGHRSGGGDAKGLLDGLDEVSGLEKGHFLKGINDLFGGKLCHGSNPFGFPCLVHGVSSVRRGRSLMVREGTGAATRPPAPPRESP